MQLHVDFLSLYNIFWVFFDCLEQRAFMLIMIFSTDVFVGALLLCLVLMFPLCLLHSSLKEKLGSFQVVLELYPLFFFFTVFLFCTFIETTLTAPFSSPESRVGEGRVSLNGGMVNYLH